MGLYIFIAVGVVLSFAFHFLGVYTNSKRSVWVAIALIWVGAVSFSLSEIKPEGYEYIKMIEGKYSKVDSKIQSYRPVISVYELLSIKKSYIDEEGLVQ